MSQNPKGSAPSSSRPNPPLVTASRRGILEMAPSPCAPEGAGRNTRRRLFGRIIPARSYVFPGVRASFTPANPSLNNGLIKPPRRQGRQGIGVQNRT